MSYNDYVIDKLQEANENVDVRIGSPLRILLVDILTLFMGPMEDEIDETKTQPIETTAANFLVDKDDGDPSKLTIRAYFYNPVTIDVPASTATILDDEGNSYSNTNAITISSDEMRLFVDGIYYYVDFEITGTALYNTNVTFSWQDSDDELAMLSVQSVSTSGSPEDTEDVLNKRIIDSSTLRSQVTRPGTSALLDSEYGAQLRESLCIGFLDSEMERDIIDNVHMGGYMDVYVKGNLPTETYIEDTLEESTTRTVTDRCSFAFVDTTVQLPWVSMTVATVSSYLRPVPVTFTDGVDYAVNLTAGTFTILGGSIYRASHTLVADPVGTNTFSISGVNLTSSVFEDFMLKFDDGGTEESEMYLVKTVTYSAPNTIITIDRLVDAAITPPWTGVTIYEPVECDFTHIPIGIELADMSNPVTRIDGVHILDPLTGDESGVDIERQGGFGAGSFGGGGWGTGDSYGWDVIIDDSTLRFSTKETGFFRFPGTYISDDIKVNYAYDPDVAGMQTFLEENRTNAADVLVKCYIPVNTTLSIDVTSSEDITGMDQYMWSMTGTINISSIISELHSKGATQVDIDDLMTKGTYEAWLADGSFVQYQPDPEGTIDLSNRLLRLHPQDISIVSR